MKLGISRPSKTVEESVAVLVHAREFGFEGVQLKPAQYMDVLSREAFHSRYAGYSDLSRGGLIVYPGRNPAKWEELLAPTMAFSEEIGAQHLCICSNAYQSGATNAEIQDTAGVLMRIGESAGAKGLRISIHNHVKSLVETEDDIARMLDAIDPNLCGLTFDTAHAAKAGMVDIPKFIGRFRTRLINVHLKDLDSCGKFCPLGRGILDLRAILRDLRERSYDEWLIVDEESPGISTADAFRIARNFLDENS